MPDRIGTLDLHYRIGGGVLAPALTTGLDRALKSGLGEALERRLAALDGDGRAVTVVRALHAPVTLDVSRCRLDSQVVDTFSRACTTALADLLSSDPPADTIMRFDDDVAFAGAFVVALLAGSAWEHWYFGAFHRYRRADTGATLRALLEESGIAPTALFAWLARHGHLPALFVHVPPSEARRLLCAGGGDEAADGSDVLVACARRLLAVLAPPHAEQIDEHIEAYLVLHPIRPAWTSRASLSAWIVHLLRSVLRVRDDAAFPAPSPAQRDALRALLSGPFDWLDAAWVEAQLCGEPDAPAPPARRAGAAERLLTPRQQDVLRRLADRVRRGELSLPAGADDDATIVHLVALAARDAGHQDALERGLVATIELAVQAMRAAPPAAPVPSEHASAHRPRPVAPAAPGGTAAGAALRAAGPAALALLDALRDRTASATGMAADSAMAGVFLLARAVDDLRLPALADDAGVPGPALRAALAMLWSGQRLDADRALPLWCGNAGDAPALPGAAVDVLNGALLALLGARRILDGDDPRACIDADAEALLSDLPPFLAADARPAATACLLLRAWSWWLPGLAGSGPLFVLRNCIRRHGGIRVSGRSIHVELDPAPLDVVVRMAGYLAPFGPVSWLGGRTVVFTLRDRVSAPAP